MKSIAPIFSLAIVVCSIFVGSSCTPATPSSREGGKTKPVAKVVMPTKEVHRLLVKASYIIWDTREPGPGDFSEELSVLYAQIPKESHTDIDAIIAAAERDDFLRSHSYEAAMQLLVFRDFWSRNPSYLSALFTNGSYATDLSQGSTQFWDKNRKKADGEKTQISCRKYCHKCSFLVELESEAFLSAPKWIRQKVFSAGVGD